jgi:hypothetical protein
MRIDSRMSRGASVGGSASERRRRLAQERGRAAPIATLKWWNPAPDNPAMHVAFLPTLLAVAPDLGLAAVFLFVWLAPVELPEGVVGGLTLVMLLEFIIVHSSAFMGQVLFGSAPRPRKAALVLGLSAFYTLFVGGFALAFKTWWPLVSFWGLQANRLLGVLVGQPPSGEEKAFLGRTWVAGVMFYLGGAFATILLPIPRFGLTPGVVAGQHLTGGGLWIDEPHRAMAFGFLYFAATAISELYGHRWLNPAHIHPSIGGTANAKGLDPR